MPCDGTRKYDNKPSKRRLTMASDSLTFTVPPIGHRTTLLTWILCLAQLFTFIFSQEIDTAATTTTSIAAYDCVDPNNRQTTHQVRRGDITTVCLYVGPSGSWNSNIDYKRFSVNLIADEFSSYAIPGCEYSGGCCLTERFPTWMLDTQRSMFNHTHSIIFAHYSFQAFNAIASTSDESNIFNSDAAHIFAASQSS